MKQIFPLLLCYVLSVSQLHAVDGGPVYTSGINTVGQYSGVIQGVTETDDLNTNGPAIPGDPLPAPNNSTTTPSNAIGLFTLNVPSTGTSSGAFLLFADGEVFTGTITASADPDSAKLIGILEGAYNFNLTTFNTAGNAVTTAVTAQAVGEVNAKITSSPVFTRALGRLTGTAFLDINFGEVDATTLSPVVARSINFNVLGFKQSVTAATGTTTT
jgi:hypothetical protein